MSLRLKPYPEYRDSGLDWLGPVPAHWQIARNGRFFDQRVETGAPELPILEVSLRTGVRVRDMDTGRKQQMADRAKYKVARRGDLAYNVMRMWQGAAGIAPCDGLVSPAYIVAAPRPGIDVRYFDYMLRTREFRREIEFASRGIVPDRNRLYWNFFKPLACLAFPVHEQRIISDFLDAYTHRVHRLQAVKRSIIAALLERKQGIVGEILAETTRGERRRARLKDWCFVNRESLGEQSDPEFTFDYFDISVVETGGLVGRPMSMQLINAPSRARRILRAGDTLISTVRTYLKAVYHFADWPRAAVASTGFAVLTPRDCVVADLIAYAVLSPSFINEVIARSVGVVYPAIAESRLSALHLELPTDLNEQRDLVARIAAETAAVDGALAREKAQLSLMEEYQANIVSRIVMGQLDVRTACLEAADIVPTYDVASEPDLEDELEPVD